MGRPDYLGVEEEPALRGAGGGSLDPAESKAATAAASDPPADLYEAVRDSVFSEPQYGDAGAGLLHEVIARRENATNGVSRLGVTLLAGIIGGLLAVPGVFVSSFRGGGWGILAVVLVGPTLEELLKPSGMIWLLERKPHWVKAGWQFAVTALLGGLVFAVLENLLYGSLYLRHLPREEWLSVMAFRWQVCTALHIVCTLISTLGLRQAWRSARLNGAFFQLHDAFPYFAAAIAVHGLYNLAALLLL